MHITVRCDLFSIAAELGQRGFIGKVSMDQNSPHYYVETTEQAIEDAERYFSCNLFLKS